MTSTSMHFGPEWMRTKPQPSSRSQPPPSPPPNSSTLPSGASSYSALVSPVTPLQPDKRDEAHPFRYSKEELLRIFRENGSKGGLGLEVERWEGVVREVGSDPIGLREMGEAEKKLYSGPLNSELRRRQSSDYLSPLSTQNLGSGRPGISSAAASPMRERFTLMKRRDSTDQLPSVAPRKLSLSNQPPASPGLPSPRARYTPGFDGILNNGDSWVARRRASEGILKGGGPSREASGEYSDGGGLEIKEEDEGGQEAEARIKDRANSLQPESSSSALGTGKLTQEPIDIQNDMAQLYLDANGQDSAPGMGPPPGLTDLASVEWSYLDPQGQVQGPFRADVMQKWHDEGYFTQDLFMKRTVLDKDWITVADLARQAIGDKLFLSPPPPSLPPGIPHRIESPQQGILSHAQESNIFSGPYHPTPTRSLRSSTLDSYIANSSNSASPASSFGAARFGNGSPDSNAFGGRGSSSYSSTDPSAVRIGSFPTEPSSLGRRNTFADTSLGLGSPSLGNLVPGRVPSNENFPFNNNAFSAPQAWPAANIGPNFDVLNPGRVTSDPMPLSSSFGPGTSGPTPLGPGPTYTHVLSQEPFSDPSSGNATFDYGLVDSGGQTLNRDDNGLTSSYSQYGGLGGVGIPYGNKQQQQQFPPPTPQTQQPHISNVYDQQAQNQRGTSQLQPSGPFPPISPWGQVPDPADTRRPGPFDPPHPTASNTVVRPSPWGNVVQSNGDSSQRLPSSQVSNEPWAEEPRPSSLTISNVGQHDQQQLNADTTSAVPEPQRPDAAVPIDIVPAASSTVKKPRNKLQTQGASAPAKATVDTPQPVQIPPSPPPSAPKPAWLKEDEDKKKTTPSGVSLSLRDIQDAETKKAEVRKAAERERERVARASASAAAGSEETQPFTASWGLPTSQAGSRPQLKESASAAALTTPTPPVWTTTTKPSAPKTMKEIQEEEERRKKTATKESAAAIAVRRAYADSANKGATPVQNSAWTTVGSSGKAAVVAPAPLRPTLTPSSSLPSSSTVPRSNGVVAARPAAPAATVKAPSIPAKQDDNPVPPSHEFVKWLSDSLKGLNSSVNVEEIMSMLLSFPLDPDPSTLEIISETIYANSTTLDGRRFATDFVTRRKTDAASRPRGAGNSTAGAGKAISIADIVKAQPKPPASSEWGGFKVVNKKKKAGRS